MDLRTNRRRGQKQPRWVLFYAILVTVLTQPPKTLRSWDHDAIQKIRTTGSGFGAQKMIFDESTQQLSLLERANIDLVTVYGKDKAGKPKTARVPRFMIWRDAFKIKYDGKTRRLSAWAEPKKLSSPSQLKAPVELFEFSDIEKFELSQHADTYPGTKLKIQTNPAASRGEKFFTQNCLACHSFHHPLDPTKIGTVFARDQIDLFRTRHEKPGGIVLDSRDIRGLTAYSEALALEKSKVESSK